jgi:glycosyltransferase involved in cell wall biosynthesis
VANPFPRGVAGAVAVFEPDVIHLHHPYWLGGLGLRLARVNPDGRRLLITLARLSPEKNLGFIIRAMARLKRVNGPPFRLIILGESAEHARLAQLVRALDLTSDVSLLGRTPYEEVPAYLAAADIFVYASSSETQGMVILEAMAAGLPVVAVNASGIDAFVAHEKTGFVTTENINLWTHALQQLLQDDCKQAAMGQAGRSVAGRHSTEAFATGVSGAYRAALGSSHG